MGLFTVFQKKKVPETLPDLAIVGGGPTVSSMSTSTDLSPIKPEKKYTQEIGGSGELSLSQKTISPVQMTPSLFERKELMKPDRSEVRPVFSGEEEGYFKDVVKHAMEEMGSLDKLDAWYTSKFASEDVVHQLRDYWQHQKPEQLIKTVGADLREKIIQKADQLHELEKDWQEVYFMMLSKEEALRKEEKELKLLLKEFVELCKKYTRNPSDLLPEGTSLHHDEEQEQGP